MSWLHGSFQTPDFSKKTGAASVLEAEVFKFWTSEMVPARAGRERLVDLRSLCGAFEVASGDLTIPSILEVLVRFSLRHEKTEAVVTPAEDLTFLWLLIHWFGSCTAELSSKTPESALAPLVAVRAVWSAYGGLFDGNFFSYYHRMVTDDPARKPFQRDDVCVYFYRDLSPSFIHGFVWHYVMQQRARGVPFASAVGGFCDSKVLSTIYSECRHSIGHATFYWALADLGMHDITNLTVPLEGAFADDQGANEKRLNDKINDLVKDTAIDGETVYMSGATHSMHIYVDQHKYHGTFWNALLRADKRVDFPPDLPPMAKPCDYDAIGNHPVSTFTRMP